MTHVYVVSKRTYHLAPDDGDDLIVQTNLSAHPDVISATNEAKRLAIEYKAGRKEYSITHLAGTQPEEWVDGEDHTYDDGCDFCVSNEKDDEVFFSVNAIPYKE